MNPNGLFLNVLWSAVNRINDLENGAHRDELCCSLFIANPCKIMHLGHKNSASIAGPPVRNIMMMIYTIN